MTSRLSRKRKDTSLVTYGHIADVVRDKIRDMILDGQAKPGDWLRQADLASTLGVSVMPVREALRALEAEGLVVFYPMRGAQVTRFSIPQVVEMDLILEELEVLACKWLAEDFNRVDMARLEGALAGLEQAERQHNVNERLKMVREFKYALYEAAEKPLLLEILSNLFDMGVRYRRIFSEAAGLGSARVQAYRRIYTACEARDAAELVAGTRDLYALARRTVLAGLQHEEPVATLSSATLPATGRAEE